MRFHLLIVLFTLSLFSCQNEVNTEYTDPPSTSLSSPDNALHVHLYYLQPESYKPDTSALAFPVRNTNQAKKLAIKMKEIYDGKGLYVSVGQLPTNTNYIDSTSQNAIYKPFPTELPKVYLQKERNKWVYSDETIRAIPSLHASIYSWPVRAFKQIMNKIGFSHLSPTLYIAIALLLLGLLTITVFFTLNKILNFIFQRASFLKKMLVQDKLTYAARLCSFIIISTLLLVLLPALDLDVYLFQTIKKIILIFRVFFVVLLGFAIVDIMIVYFRKLTGKTASKMDDQLIPIVYRTAQVFVGMIGLVEVLQLLNINITALIAGISIGSLAIALAAQDTVKNLFGSATIFIDKPFQIGDWINFDGIDGTVEEVGFRSTRIRTFENSLVSIPNGKLADGIINNYGLRVFRRFKMEVGVTYKTSPENLEKFVDSIREIVRKYPNSTNENYHIYVNSLGESSINILVYIFFNVATWGDELQGKQDIILEIMRSADKIGVDFAFPSKSIYFENFPDITTG